MRVMRDAGARGLAGLFAESDVVRPLVRIARRTLVQYARSRALTWVEDPSNASPVYLRNRIRGDILPALRRVRPNIDRELLAIARSSARLRGEVETHVAALPGLRVHPRGYGLDVPVAGLPTREAALALWPAIAAKAGVTMDRRGLARLASFTINGRAGARVQLSGGWEVVRSRGAFELRPSDTETTRAVTAAVLALSAETRWGDWSFRAGATEGADAWTAWLPCDRPLSVRPWQPGDAMPDHSGPATRKVKHLLTDAGVTGHQRAGWPVVVAGDEIVWVPGVRRIEAAAARSGRPGLTFTCEYIYR
jgi:tRNA(Ile)-lysidine synthetase-like protein